MSLLAAMLSSPGALRALVVGLACACLATGCSDSPPTAPDPITPVGPGPAGSVILQVVDGLDGAGVGGARLTIDGRSVEADRDGRFEVSLPLPCDWTLIEAPGYFPRQVTCLSWAVEAGRSPLTLWPLGRPGEAEALQTFAFPRDQLVTGFTQAVDVDRFVPQPDEILATWIRAGSTLAAATGQAFKTDAVSVVLIDEGLVLTPRSPVTSCDHPAFPWAGDVAGFCWTRGPGYFITRVLIAPDRLTDEAVALRGLLTAAGFLPHDLPGLMNRVRPATALSDFERRALTMVGQRRVPAGRVIEFPDTER